MLHSAGRSLDIRVVSERALVGQVAAEPDGRLEGLHSASRSLVFWVVAKSALVGQVAAEPDAKVQRAVMQD